MFKDTAIYTYEVPGIGAVYADPLAIRRGLLLATSGRCWEWAQKAKDYEDMILKIPEDQASEETIAARRAEWATRLAELEGALVRAAYSAFGFQPIDPATGDGQTEAVVLDIFRAFLEWIEQKKSEPDSTPT